MMLLLILQVDRATAALFEILRWRVFEWFENRRPEDSTLNRQA